MEKSKKSDRKPLFVLKVYKRHILFLLALIITAGLGYASYFRRYMVLPQSTINVLQEAPFALKNSKVLIFAPHCDDETLGSGGLIQEAIKQNSNVKVVITTDCNYHKNGQTRKGETISALKTLGLNQNSVSFLDFPERGDKVAKNLQEGEKIKTAISSEISDFGPNLVIFPHPQDTHVDHATVGRLGEEVTNGKSDYTVAYYLIHYNFLRFPSPSGLRPSNYLLPPAVLINFTDRWYKFSLTQEEEDAKEDATGEYRSQLKSTNPVLYRILYDFVRKNELFMIRS